MDTSVPTSSGASPRRVAFGRRWHRSLYGRIALGFIATAAAVIAVQAAVVVWLLSRSGPSTGPPPPAFARLVADDLGRRLSDTPDADLDEFIREEYEQRLFPFVVVFGDGRVLSHNGASISPTELTAARELLTRVDTEALPANRPRGPLSDGRRSFERPGGPPFLGRGARDGADRLLRARGRARPGIVRVKDRAVGVVLVVPQTVGQRLGPTLVVTGSLALALATALMAFLVFGPARARLANLRDAARAVGRGDLSARAREDGGDEVAELARAFNHMTSDLAARGQALADADRTRRLLLADVSHELRTPLTSMRGYLETLAMPSLAGDAAKRDRYVSILSEETRRLEQLVDDLLELAKLEARGTGFDVQEVPIDRLFNVVVERHQLAAGAREVTLVSRTEPDVVSVKGDARRLEQALDNLLSNALRHTPVGGQIALTSAREGSHVVLRVADTGAGIPAEHLPHIFDRFYKADSARGGAKAGSGLGLSIVKAIADLHGGTVAVTSSTRGSTFALRLPE